MNERIKQLAEQAGGNPNYKAFRGYFLPPPPDYIDPATVNLEKFAELIVGECADIMDGRDENGNAKDGQYLLTKFDIDASQRYT